MRISESLPVAVEPGRLAALGDEAMELRAGPISIPFRCRFESGDAGDGGVRLRGHGVAPGAGFTLDLELRPLGDAVRAEGELLVSGTLAGLGQREVGLQVRRLLANVLAAP